MFKQQKSRLLRGLNALRELSYHFCLFFSRMLSDPKTYYIDGLDIKGLTDLMWLLWDASDKANEVLEKIYAKAREKYANKHLSI